MKLSCYVPPDEFNRRMVVYHGKLDNQTTRRAWYRTRVHVASEEVYIHCLINHDSGDESA